MQKVVEELEKKILKVTHDVWPQQGELEEVGGAGLGTSIFWFLPTMYSPGVGAVTNPVPGPPPRVTGRPKPPARRAVTWENPTLPEEPTVTRGAKGTY